jgi:hypothetical protein
MGPHDPRLPVRSAKATTVLQQPTAARPFISYSRRDLPFVRDLVRGLRQAGIEPWLDLTGVSGGDRWNASIETALRECSHCLVVVSPYAMRSVEVRRELAFALQHHKPVVPVLLQTTQLPEDLKSSQWIDFRISYDRALRILLARLRGERLHADTDLLAAPPRPRKFLGFVPMLYIACPTAVKTVSGLVFIAGFLKFMLGFFLTDFAQGDQVVLGGLLALTAVFAMWWTFRAANRRSTFTEMAFVAGFPVFFTCLGLTDDPRILWPLLVIPLDLIALMTIIRSRAYRRWMTTYSVGWGRELDGA